jgi:serpin B
MKQLTVAFLLGALALCLPGRADAQPQLKPDTKAVVDDNNAFAFDLYARLRAQPGNLFFSPYSISSALAMTYAGARGQTADEMATALHFALPPERLHAGFADLSRELNNQGKPRKAKLQVANRLWGQKDYGFLPGFLKLTEDNYGADLKEVDFAGNTEQARQTINTWVEEKTQQKIKELLKPGILNVDTRLVLTNAIYFKASWQRRFDPKATVDGPFFVTADKQVTAKLMKGQIRTNFRNFGDVAVLELPYQDHELSMFFLLPRQKDGLAALEKNLTAAKLQEWTGKLSDHIVQVTLPKFKVTAEFELNAQLQALDMKRAFVPGQADFSGMATRDKLFLRAVIHKAFIDLYEEGTEAAAATAAVIERQSAPPRGTFTADHPFTYVLRDNRTGAILFLGRLTNPQ